MRQQGLHFEPLLVCPQGLQKKWEDSFALWKELENKKGRAKGNASMGDAIDVDAQGPCIGNPEGTDLAAGARKRRPPGHKANKADIAR
jgi:hypothetical protein